MRIKIADGFEIDYGLFRTEGMRTAILARSGGGKSNLAAVMAESFLDQGAQVCIIEPIEEWYTLKAAYDSVVWVSEDGDLPLSVDMAHHYVGILENGGSMVITVATGDEFNDKQFVADFLWSLYVRWKKVRRPMFLFVEEADTYAPQMWSREDRLCLSRMALIAKRGRKLGINPVIISQRPADIHKSVISQSNILFLGGFKTTQDLEAVRTLSKLLHLPIPTEEVSRLEPGEFYAVVGGEAYRVRARMRRTPHAGATPELVKVRPQLEDFVVRLRDEVVREMERAKEEKNELARLRRENEALRGRIAELEEQLSMVKIVKEVPIEIKAVGSAEAQASLNQQQQMPEIILRSRYPQTSLIYNYLSKKAGPATMQEISAATGVGHETVRRVVRYMRRKGLVRVRVAHLPGGKEAIRWVAVKT